MILSTEVTFGASALGLVSFGARGLGHWHQGHQGHRGQLQKPGGFQGAFFKIPLITSLKFSSVLYILYLICTLFYKDFYRLYFEKYQRRLTSNLCDFCWISLWFRNWTSPIFIAGWNTATENKKFCRLNDFIRKKHVNIFESKGGAIQKVPYNFYK